MPTLYEARGEDRDFFRAFSRATSTDSGAIELLRGPAGEDVEFATVMWFDSLESVKAFAGADYETAVVIAQSAPLA